MMLAQTHTHTDTRTHVRNWLICWFVSAVCRRLSAALLGKTFRTAIIDYEVAFKVKILYPSVDPTSFVFALNNR